MADNPSTDWRDVIAQNRRRTYFVMATFVALYMALGFIIDLLYQSPFVHAQLLQYNINESASLVTAKLLLTGKLFPYATVSAGVVAFIAILITLTFNNRIMLMGTSYRLITPENAKTLAETQLYNAVEEMKIAAGLQFMPKVYIIDADYMNAFASGLNEKSAMIAITKGLLEKLDRDEMQAVIAHELSHIRHQDTRLILTVSVLTNLMLLIIDVLFYNLIFSRDRRGNQGIIVVIILLRYLLPLITALLALYLSRKRELMADAGAVELTRQNEPLARALIKINDTHRQNPELHQQAYQQTAHDELRQAAYIYSPKAAGISSRPGFSSLWSTHPSLQERLKAIGYKYDK
jgi:heat shock protein HtpX